MRERADTPARIPELDGIRGLAMLLVLVWHYFACQVRTEPATTASYAMKIFAFTWAGVDLFFVLSGFLIGGILLDQRELGRRGWHGLATRLWP